MAVWDGEDFEAGPRAGGLAAGGAGRLLRTAGAALSAALVVGLVLWAYRLAERQINGVPVLAAPEGPARIAPENPGGELADHQGLSVNMIAAEGEAERAADLLVLAPKPQLLSDDDVASDALQISAGTALAPPAVTGPGPHAGTVQPSSTLAAMQPARGQISEPLPDGPVDPIVAPELETVEAGSVEAGSVEAALIEAGVLPPAATDPATDPAAPNPEAPNPEAIAADIPGVAASPIPPMRPGPAGIGVFAEPAAPLPEVADTDPATLVAGTALAHIGSYEDEARARAAWDAAVQRFGALFRDKGRVIQTAESGGRTIYRLRVTGFESRDDARRFCSALKAGGACVPVQVR